MYAGVIGEKNRGVESSEIKAQQRLSKRRKFDIYDIGTATNLTLNAERGVID